MCPAFSVYDEDFRTLSLWFYRGVQVQIGDRERANPAFILF